MKVFGGVLYLKLEEGIKLSAKKIGGSAEMLRHEGGDLTKERPLFLGEERGVIRLENNLFESGDKT